MKAQAELASQRAVRRGESVAVVVRPCWATPYTYASNRRPGVKVSPGKGRMRASAHRPGLNRLTSVGGSVVMGSSTRGPWLLNSPSRTASDCWKLAETVPRRFDRSIPANK